MSVNNFSLFRSSNNSSIREIEELKLVLQQKQLEIKHLEDALRLKCDRVKHLEMELLQYKETDSGSVRPQKKAARGIGISAEPRGHENFSDSFFKTKPKMKEKKTKECLVRALLENDFTRKMSANQISEIVDCMYPVNANKNSWIIQEGQIGSSLYAIEEGTVEIVIKGEKLREMGMNSIFGELAILYNCTRTASVRAKSDCLLWAIDRKVFQSIMVKSGMKRQEEHIKFLRSVPIFKTVPLETLSKIADGLQETHYKKDEYIVREGAIGDTFYLISNGKVKVTKNTKNGSKVHQALIRFLDKGEWFGEKALQDEDVRTANIIAVDAEGVDCLVLDRESYNLWIRNIPELHKTYEDENLSKSKRNSFSYLTLKDLCFVGTIGIGGFGRVELVQIGKDKSQSFALKKLKKHHIVQCKQQEHVLNERKIMLEIESGFIVKLYKTFRDRKFLYMLMEVCLGGEVWTILRDRKTFDDATAKFYVACSLMAIEYLHRKGIVYRDLKPENLVIDSHGYCKLTDFGFAKKIGFLQKTWTFCGTREYVAPEIILNKGHDSAADFWSLGILMFELLSGTPPFSTDDPMKTYAIILKGIEAIDIPSCISKSAYSLIKKLCRDNPSERLGYGKKGICEIQKHVWFESFNWDGLMSKTCQPPIIPKITSTTDMGNFDNYPPDEDIPLDDTTGWDNDFEM